MNEHDRGWLEALIDGEGSLTVTKNKAPHPKRGFGWNLRLRIASADYYFLENARRIIGMGVIHGYDKGVNHQPSYVLQITQNGLRTLLPQLHLITKEPQRQLFLEALSLLSEHRHHSTPNDARLEQIWKAVHHFNYKKGLKRS